MNILGLQTLTLLDYPEHVAAVLFLGGCNFRCPFCQNAPLVLSPDTQPVIPREELRRFLKKRAGILDGICITGGEPTLYAQLPDLLSEIKSFGYLVKLDTNGTNPDLLELLIREKLTDYVAVDIKAGRTGYAHVCGLDRHPAASGSTSLLASVSRSIRLLMQSPVEYEFRTTAVRGLHTEQDFEDIAVWVGGCRKYFLQSFRDSGSILEQNHSFSAFSESELQNFLSIVRRTIPQAQLRGI